MTSENNKIEEEEGIKQIEKGKNKIEEVEENKK